MKEGARAFWRIVGGILFVLMLPLVYYLFVVGSGKAVLLISDKLHGVWGVIAIVAFFVVIALVAGFARVISAGGSPGKLSGFFRKDD